MDINQTADYCTNTDNCTMLKHPELFLHEKSHAKIGAALENPPRSLWYYPESL